jgi:saccharopine dehydrogenase (NADP+, L-glutamate forming)
MAQSALLLGSGFVATPTVEVLTKAGISVTIACRTLASAEKLAAGFPHTKAISLDINDTTTLEAEVAKHDVTISLVPYTYHIAVVKAALKTKKHVITTSYVSPAMQALDEEAKAAGITVMNEIGVSRIGLEFTGCRLLIFFFSLILGMPSDRHGILLGL